MPAQRPTPFLTLEDPNAKIKGSRDPLGVQPIWAVFGRHVVTNLTTQSSSVRGFTTLLLGRYFAAELVDKGMASREDALDVFLRMEQLSAYVRHVAHGVEGEIRGIERVRKTVEETRGRVPIHADRRGSILSDQKVYGLWGLYSVSARTSGLIPEGALDVTEDTRAFLKRNYIDRLDGAAWPLLRLLARGGTLGRWCIDPRAANTAATRRLHGPIANEAGRPSSVMRFKMLHAMAASVSWAMGCRARSRPPMIDLYRKKAFSTRACRW